MLLFKKKFLQAIRRGEKTQTIRLWKHRRMRAGQRSYIPGVGYIHINAVDQVDLDKLTEEDALKDGFASIALLQQEIEQLYPSEKNSDTLPFRIRFTLLPPEQQKKNSSPA